MRLGLLRCEEIGQTLASVHGGYFDLFNNLFGHVDEATELSEYDVVTGELPNDPAEQDAWLVSGSYASSYDDDPWIISLLNLLRNLDAARAPTVGICFGHQALAQALGGNVRRSDEGWGVGVQSAELISSEDWIPPSYDKFDIVYSHRDQVVTLPRDARLIASSAHCPIAAFAVRDHLLGIQGHPEFTTSLAADLYSEMEPELGSETTAAAQTTLNTGTNSIDIAAWILRFVSQQHT